MTTTQIGSGRPQFILPNGRFDQVTLAPLSRVGSDVKIVAIAADDPEIDRLLTARGL